MSKSLNGAATLQTVADAAALASIYRPYRRTIFQGLPVVTSRPNGQNLNTGNLSNGTDTSGNYRYLHQCLVGASDICLVYGNYYSGGTPGPNSITVTAAVENPTAATQNNNGQTGAKLQVTWGGAPSVTIQPGGIVVSDPIPMRLPAGQYLATRTYVSVSAAGQKWPVDLYTIQGSWEGATRGAPATDLTMSSTTTIGQSTEAGYGPIAVIGTPFTARTPCVGLVGDSILYGSGDTNPNGMGFAVRALAAANIPYISVAKPGEQASSVNTEAGFQKRMALTAACTAVIEEYGQNDRANGRTLAQIQADRLTLWGYYADRGIKVYATTNTPNTTSTDSWATTTNQTLTSSESIRTQLNDWLRDGAPIDATSKAAVPRGTTSNVLRAGSPGHPLVGYIEVADTVETARNSGIWKASYTGDGTHPNATGHAAAASAIPTAKLALV